MTAGQSGRGVAWHRRMIGKDGDHATCPECGKDDQTMIWLNSPGKCFCHRCDHRWTDEALVVPAYLRNPESVP